MMHRSNKSPHFWSEDETPTFPGMEEDVNKFIHISKLRKIVDRCLKWKKKTWVCASACTVNHSSSGMFIFISHINSLIRVCLLYQKGIHLNI